MVGACWGLGHFFDVDILKRVTISYCIMCKLLLLRKNVHFSKFVPLLPSAISVLPAWWYSILLLLASLLIQMRLFLSIDLPQLLFQLRAVIIPLSAPKKYWRQSFGALLLKSLVYCVTAINHLGFTRLFSLILNDNVVQASAASMYTEKKINYRLIIFFRNSIGLLITTWFQEKQNFFDH